MWNENSKCNLVLEKLLKINNSENPKLELKIIDEILWNDSSDGILEDIAKSILNRTPIQYYANYTYINNIKIFINHNVLLPGPEMEYMIKLCKKHMEKNGKIMDLCCGSGVVSTVLAVDNPNIFFYATDISKEALVVAQKNFTYYKLENVYKYKGDLFEPFENEKIFDFDVIVANPPYCKTGIISSLPVPVRDHAPRIAIDGGEDGLQLHRRIICNAHKYLKENGIIILQNEDGQSNEVRNILEANGYEIIEISKNHLDQERLIAARLKSSRF